MSLGKVFAYIAIVIKAILYGTTVIFTSKLLEKTGVFDILALRFIVSAAAFILLQLFGFIKVNFKGKGKDLWLLCVTALFEPGLYFIFETYGIAYTSTILFGVISATMPFFVFILETVFLKERTSIPQKLFLFIRVFGLVFITLFADDSGKTVPIGVLFTLLSVISGAAFLVASRGSSAKFSSVEITYFTNIFGAVFFNAINIVRHSINGTMTSYFEPFMDKDCLIGLLYLGILSSALATGLNNFALSRLQASLTVAIGGLTTLTTIITGVLFNNESYMWYHTVGIILMFTGMIGMSVLSERKGRTTVVEDSGDIKE